MPSFSPAFERSFRARFFPEATAADWADAWWQLAHRIRTPERLLEVLPDLLPAQRRALARSTTWRMPLLLTPYAAALLASLPTEHPYRRTLLPDVREARVAKGDTCDPLGELPHLVAPGLVHAYPKKALLLATADCASSCRYCTRARTACEPPATDFGPAFAYLRAHPEIDDVLISGGDPLTLPDAALERLLDGLASIPSVTFLRIGTKVPAMLPQRVTPGLVRLLKRYRPLWLSLHFSHPAELTARAGAALRRLSDAGLPLMNQCVLLRGVNDDAEVLQELFSRLIRLNVKPYYLHHADQAAGTGHFRTPMARGRALLRQIAPRLTGYALPRYMVDPYPGGRKHPID